MIMDWTANAGASHKPVVVSDQKILAFYNHFAHGNPDAGANMLDVLVYWRKNGHCIPAVGYDSRNLYIVTWGQLKTMSWPFYDAYADEAFAVLSPDWLDPKAKAPVGFDEATLKQDLAVIDKV